MNENARGLTRADAKKGRCGRLPPGQSLTRRFPVLHNGPVPAFDEQAWDLTVFGEVEQEARWGWGEFCQLPRARATMDIHCVTAWSKLDTEWEGVSLRELVDRGLVRPKSSATVLVQHCEFGYTTNMPLSAAMGENVLLATYFGGDPIAPEHGFPLRVVCGAIPGREDLEDVYLWKGGKWLRGLELLSEDRPGYWEQAGYHNRGRVWGQERFSGR